MDYRATLHLPKTSFPMRANLAEREPMWLQRWKTVDLYAASREVHRNHKKFILHDGPPYANGDIHTGTALNKIVKDMINRYWSFQGYDTPFVPGWDTHGLPIELRALRQLGVTQHEIDPLTLRAECAKVAEHFIPLMTEQFERLGILADWSHPYVTMDPQYEADEIRIFAAMVENDLIYRDRMPVYWCPECETALAEAEVEYHDQTADALTVGFALAPRDGFPEGVRALIWTTTPWTIPSNVAIAVHPDLSYVVVETPKGALLLAEARVEPVLAELGIVEGRRSNPFPGRDLEGWMAHHPYLDREIPIILGEHVTQDSGTGLVHTAPGHGMDDYLVGLRYQLPLLQPLDDRGVFESEATAVGGLFYRDANPVIIDRLRQTGALFGVQPLTHQNTFCWRCKEPVIYRATHQWFMSVARLRPELLAGVDQVRWDPAWGQERIRGMVRDRRDWCLSRQRAYGVPIPVLYCEGCGQATLTPSIIRGVADRVAEHGSDVWWREPAKYFLPEDFSCSECGYTMFRQERDVFDVWMDSGASQQVLERRPDLAWPADLVLEGNDQYRGWFMALLTEGVARHGEPPYRGVLTHGWVLDKAGREMHKSLGNTVDPLETVERYGADILRLWIASSEFRTDVRISDDLLQQLAETYRKFRNTIRFLLGNLADFDPVGMESSRPVSDPLNRWVVTLVDQWLNQADHGYRTYQFHTVVHGLIRLLTWDLSSFYLDVIKDRLYTLGADDPLRRETQRVLYHILEVMVIATAPIFVFTSEEIYETMVLARPRQQSVHLESWPQPWSVDYSNGERDRMTRLLRDREAILKALESQRESKLIGNSLEADVDLVVPIAEREFDREQDALLLAELTMTARVAVSYGPELAASAARTAYARCERCWRYTADVQPGPADPLCDRCRQVLSVLGADRESI